MEPGKFASWIARAPARDQQQAHRVRIRPAVLREASNGATRGDREDAGSAPGDVLARHDGGAGRDRRGSGAGGDGGGARRRARRCGRADATGPRQRRCGAPRGRRVHAGRGPVPDVSDRRRRHRRLHAGTPRGVSRLFPGRCLSAQHPPRGVAPREPRAPGRDRGDGGQGGDRQGGDRAARGLGRPSGSRRAGGRAVGSAAENDHAGDPDPRAVQCRHLLRGPSRGGGPGQSGRLPPRGRDAHLRGPPGAGEPRRQRPSRSRRRSGAARAVPAPRLPRVSRRLLGRDQGGGGARPPEHHAAAAGLPLLPQRQPGPRPRGVGGAVSRSWSRC